MKKPQVALFTDFSAPCNNQLAATAAWVNDQEAAVCIYTCYDPSPGYMGGGRDGTQMTVEEMGQRLDDLKQELNQMTTVNCAVSHRILEGNPIEKVPAEINHLIPDLVVMGAHGHGRLHDLFMGSVLQAVIQHTTQPILLVPPQTDKDLKVGFKSIVVALDLSDSTEKTLHAAVALSDSQSNSKLHLVHVVLPPSTVVDGVVVEGFTPEIIADRKKGATDALNVMIAKRYNDIRSEKVVIHVPVGPPAAAIHSMLEETDADLLVLGSHGHGIVYSLLIGSTAEHLIYHCKKPMLVIPQGKSA